MLLPKSISCCGAEGQLVARPRRWPPCGGNVRSLVKFGLLDQAAATRNGLLCMCASTRRISPVGTP